MPAWMKKAWCRSVSFVWNTVSLFVLSLMVFSPGNAVAYTTPGTGEALTMDQLVATSGGHVTGADGAYELTQTLEITAGDTLTMEAGQSLTVTAGSNLQIVVKGTFRALGTASSRAVITGAGTAAGDWKQIYVTGAGRVEFSYCDISEAEKGVYFENVSTSASASSISSSTIIAVSSSGIYVDKMVAELTVRDSSIEACGSDGIYLQSGGRNAIRVENSTIRAAGGSAIRVAYGFENLVITGNTLTECTAYGVNVSKGGWNMEISKNTISANAKGGIRVNDSGTAGDSLRITRNTFTGNLGDAISASFVAGLLIRDNTITDHEGLKGISLNRAWNSLVELNTISGCATGLDVQNGIRGEKAQSVPYAWIEVNRGNADAWDQGADDESLAEAAIGFDFPMNGQTYTHFQTQTNGSVELVTGSGQTDDITGYEGWAKLIEDNDSSSTFLFAPNDDFKDEGPDVTEQHNGADVVMNGWGYKHFTAGSLDGEGNTVAEECTVFRWYMQYYSDDDTTGPYNDFQVVIFPDGQVRWSVRAMPGHLPEYSQLIGFYAGGSGEPLFVNAASGVRDQASYIYNPATAGDASTGIFSNTIFECTDDALVLTDVKTNRLKWNTLKNNPSGLKIAGVCSDNTIASNLFVDNIVSLTNTMAETVDAASNFWASEALSDKAYTVLDTAETIDAVIADDDEDSAIGVVTFEPFLTIAPTNPYTAVISSGSGSGCFIGSLSFD